MTNRVLALLLGLGLSLGFAVVFDDTHWYGEDSDVRCEMDLEPGVFGFSGRFFGSSEIRDGLQRFEELL